LIQFFVRKPGPHNNQNEVKLPESDQEPEMNIPLKEGKLVEPANKPRGCETFPSLRISINIREGVNTLSSIEFDKFGPILVMKRMETFISWISRKIGDSRYYKQIAVKYFSSRIARSKLCSTSS
jgi:hypothetical protein